MGTTGYPGVPVIIGGAEDRCGGRLLERFVPPRSAAANAPASSLVTQRRDVPEQVHADYEPRSYRKLGVR